MGRVWHPQREPTFLFVDVFACDRLDPVFKVVRLDELPQSSDRLIPNVQLVALKVTVTLSVEEARFIRN